MPNFSPSIVVALHCQSAPPYWSDAWGALHSTAHQYQPKPWAVCFVCGTRGAIPRGHTVPGCATHQHAIICYGLWFWAQLKSLPRIFRVLMEGRRRKPEVFFCKSHKVFHSIFMIEIVVHKPQQLLRDHNTETINSSDFFVENGREQSFEQKDNYLASEHRKLADLRENPNYLQDPAKLLLLCPTEATQQRTHLALLKATWLHWMMGTLRRCRKGSNQAEREQNLHEFYSQTCRSPGNHHVGNQNNALSSKDENHVERTRCHCKIKG